MRNEKAAVKVVLMFFFVILRQLWAECQYLTYLILIKGRRNQPERKLLDIMAEVLKLDHDEREEMYNFAG